MSKRRYPSTAERIQTFRTAWREIAPDASFGGMTFAEFEAALAPYEENAELLEVLGTKQAAAQMKRDQLDVTTRKVLSLVVNGVRGNPGFGEDSQLYKALGYVPKSERKSGLTRKEGEAVEVSPAEEAA